MPATTSAPLPVVRITHPRLLFLEVTGGYLDALRIELAPHSTCLIGGKGCGKTTVFEMMRFALGGSSLAGKDSVRSLLKKNLGSGTVRVGFETAHGVRYVAERKLADEAPRFFTDAGAPVKLGAEVLAVEAYGQDEIERVGENRASQRGLLDRLAGDALAPHVAEIARVVERLRKDADVLLTLEGEIAALESSAAEARAIEEQLAPLLAATGADAALVTKAHVDKGVRGREKQAVASAGTALGEVRAAAESLAYAAKRKLEAIVPPEARAGANAALLAELEAELVAVGGALEELAVGVLRRVDQASAAVARVRDRLGAAHTQQDAGYDALMARQKEDQTRTDERTRLQDRLGVVAGAVPRLEEKTRLHAQLRHDHDALAARLVELCDLASGVRTRTEEKHRAALERDGVRIRVKVAQQTDEYRALLREVLSPVAGGQPKWLLDRITPALRPHELVALVRAQDKAALIDRAGLSKHAERAAEVIAALTPNRHLYALQAIAIDDEVVIETLHGKVWKDTVECSPGQRSGAILPILLLEGDAPLLIDQPDDNVDPDFMCTAILPRVAALRGTRQFVFVTHHANVPVLSGAEKVVLIESDGTKAGLQAEGGVAPMKGWIVVKLEGGQGAFERRRKTYEE
jgi:hypothetical protein